MGRLHPETLTIVDEKDDLLKRELLYVLAVDLEQNLAFNQSF